MSKISELSPATELTGSETLAIVQDGSTVKTTAQDIANLVEVSESPVGAFKGEWNAFTNTPVITSGVGVKGEHYKVTTTGYSLVDAIGYWSAGDYVVFDGTYWTRIRGTNHLPAPEKAVEVLTYSHDDSPEIIAMRNDFLLNKKSKVSLKELPLSVNLSGAEWNSGTFRNASVTLNANGNLTFPNLGYLQYLKNQKVDHLRFCFAWEGLQPTLFDSIATNDLNPPYYSEHGAFHTEFLAKMKTVIEQCRDLDIKVVLDNHNYGRYNDNPVNSLSGVCSQTRTSSDGRYLFCSDVFYIGHASVFEIDGRITIPGTKVKINEAIKFTQTVRPSEIDSNKTYFVTSKTDDVITVSETPSGATVTFSTRVEVNFTIGKTDGTSQVITSVINADGTIPALNLSYGTSVKFTGSYAPTPFTLNTTYTLVGNSKQLGDHWGAPVKIPTAVNLSLPTGTAVGNGGRYLTRKIHDGTLSPAHFVDFWLRAHQEFGGYENVVGYGISNEAAIGIVTGWFDACQEVINALRDVGCTKTIYVDGPYTEATKTPYRQVAIPSLYDPLNKTEHEIHYYFDKQRSGNAFGFDVETMQNEGVETGNVQVRGKNSVAGGFAGVSDTSTIQKAASIKEFTLFKKRPYIGECAFTSTTADWLTNSAPFVYQARKQKSLVSLWGASTNPNFLYGMKLYPTIRKGEFLPSLQTAPILYDAEEHFCTVTHYYDVASRELSLTAVGNSTRMLKVTVASSPAISSLDGDYFLSDGVNPTTKLKVPVVNVKTLITVTPQNQQPQTLTLYPEAYSGTNSVDDGGAFLEKANASLFIAGKGFGDFTGAPVTNKQCLASNEGWSDSLFSVKNLSASQAAQSVSVVDTAVGKAFANTGTNDIFSLLFAGTTARKNYFEVEARENGGDLGSSNGFVYNNGSLNDAVGGFLSNETNPSKWAALIVDGYQCKAGDVVAVTNQFSYAGIYIVEQAATDNTTYSKLIRHPEFLTFKSLHEAYFRVRLGINNKNTNFAFRSYTDIGPLNSTNGLTVSGSPQYGYKNPHATKFNNYNASLSFGVTIVRTGNWTVGGVVGLVNPTGISNEISVNGSDTSNGKGFIVETTADNKIKVSAYKGDNFISTPVVYGGYSVVYTSGVIPLDTKTTIVVSASSTFIKVFFNGTEVYSTPVVSVSFIRQTWLHMFSILGYRTSYSYTYASQNLGIINAFLAEKAMTSGESAAVDAYMKDTVVPV